MLSDADIGGARGGEAAAAPYVAVRAYAVALACSRALAIAASIDPTDRALCIDRTESGADVGDAGSDAT